jgi:hypothetical protein
MRRLALAALCLAAVGCGEGEVRGEGCAAVVVWNDVTYYGVGLDLPSGRSGATLGDGTVPGCPGGAMIADRIELQR